MPAYSAEKAMGPTLLHGRGRDDEERLTADIIELAGLYCRYGYSKVTALLRDAGWRVSARRAHAHPVRQRPRVRAQGGARLDHSCGCQDGLHRARQPKGE